MRHLVLVVFLMIGLPALAADTKAAQASAKTFLALIDTGKYPQAYRSCATVVKKLVKENAFVTPVKELRTKLGPVVSRKFKSATPMTQLPGAPKGHYVVIQYTTDFKNQKATTETITPMLEADGSWKVSGYYVR